MYFLGDREAPSAEIIQRLIQFVACKPNPEHQAGKRGKGPQSHIPPIPLSSRSSKSNNRGRPSLLVYKPKSELSPFEECMDTSPTIQSSLLKLLLRCGSAPRLLPKPPVWAETSAGW